MSEAAKLVLEAFPGSTPEPDPTLWAGVADELPEGYRQTLPAGLLDAIERAGEGWRWGVCTACGRGALIPRPPTPQAPRKIGENDGPRCTGWIREDAAHKRCPGRHYPLDGPLPHPLAAEEPERPW